MAEKKVVKKGNKKVVKKPVKKVEKIEEVKKIEEIKEVKKTSYIASFSEHRGLIFSSLAIIVILVLGVWLIANAQFNSMSKMTSDENLEAMLEVGREHFKGENLPNDVHKTNKLSLREMLDKETVSLKGNVANRCDLDNSYISVTKTMDWNYSLVAKIKCMEDINMMDEPIISDSKIYKTCQGDEGCK